MPNKLPFLPDEYHYAIAHVASRAAQLDHVIEYAIVAQFKPVQGIAEFLLKNMDTSRIIGVLEILLQNNFPDRKDEMTKLIETIRTARSALTTQEPGREHPASVDCAREKLSKIAREGSRQGFKKAAR